MFFATRGKLQRLGQFTFATRGTIVLNVLERRRRKKIFRYLRKMDVFEKLSEIAKKS